jgi:hypothetical protein
MSEIAKEVAFDFFLPFDESVAELPTMIRSNNSFRVLDANWWVGLLRTSETRMGVYMFRKGIKIVSTLFKFCLKSTVTGNDKFLPREASEIKFIDATFDNKKGHGGANLIRHDELIKPENGYVKPNGTVTITVTFQLKMAVTSLKRKRIFCLTEGMSVLPDTDITLIVDGTRIALHKFVLFPHSEVFRAMLTQQMSETILSEININDFSADVVQCAIKCLYNEDDISNHVHGDNCADLFRFAHKYGIECLLNECEQTTAVTIFDFNAIERLVIGDVYGSNMIKAAAMEVLCENYFELFRNRRNIPKVPKTLWDEVMDEMYELLR